MQQASNTGSQSSKELEEVCTSGENHSARLGIGSSGERVHDRLGAVHGNRRVNRADPKDMEDFVLEEIRRTESKFENRFRELEYKVGLIMANQVRMEGVLESMESLLEALLDRQKTAPVNVATVADVVVDLLDESEDQQMGAEEEEEEDIA